MAEKDLASLSDSELGIEARRVTREIISALGERLRSIEAERRRRGVEETKDTPLIEITIRPVWDEWGEAEYVAELETLLRSYGFNTYPETWVRHPGGKSLRVDLLAIRNGIVIAFEVKASPGKFALALRQARDYVLSESLLGMVLGVFVYPTPNLRDGGDRYWAGMAKLASYDRVGIAHYHHDGLVLDFGGHVVFRRGNWTGQAHRFLLGERQFAGSRSGDWKRDRLVRRL